MTMYSFKDLLYVLNQKAEISVCQWNNMHQPGCIFYTFQTKLIHIKKICLKKV